MRLIAANALVYSAVILLYEFLYTFRVKNYPAGEIKLARQRMSWDTREIIIDNRIIKCLAN